ncbi:PspC domain-containing protein [Flavobacterium sp.]|uniref:PspC domain-containing protein n=1 Tax=Flavobacterium sp. TaxID=239 RepID=UPI00286C7974|nr:PspC domain-containing protein [Flavobacterium sp.]
MNKTVNINLGGMLFHIDEDAYQKMTRYFDAIKRSLSSSNGQEEIIKDIEIRVSELLLEKQKSEKHVVNLKDVDDVIAVMGQPEDYRIDDEGSEAQATSFASTTRSRKLFRDKENGMIGGVVAGLGHYFGVDKVWLRILLLISIFAFGTGILAYIILWIVMPEATTTSEKLEMTGEPVTISNIEKKVREEFENVSEKLKNANFDEMGNRVKTGAEKLGSSFGDFIMTVLKIFAKFLGVILIITGMATLIGLLVGVFTLGSSAFVSLPWQGFIDAGNFTDYPVWSFGLLMFFAVGIPFFFLTLLGFKLLTPNLKSIGNIAKYTLLAIWILAIAVLISIGVKQASEIAYEGKTVQKVAINVNPTDTLHVKFKFNDYYTKDINDREDFRFVQDSTNNQLIYSNNIYLKVLHTDEFKPFMQIEKIAHGKTFQDAKQRAEKIRYAVKIEGNNLILDNYLLTDVTNKFRGQEVEIYLYLPVGTLFKTDTSVEDYDRSDNDYFNLHYSSDQYIYKVESDKIKCLNCPADENEFDDNNITISANTTENDSVITTTVKVNGEEVTVNQTGKKGLSKNKDGVIIKTN